MQRRHLLHAAGAGANHQQAIGVVDGCAVRSESQEGRAQGLHTRYFATLPMTPATR
jgi:hypothetical protein